MGSALRDRLWLFRTVPEDFGAGMTVMQLSTGAWLISTA